MDPLPPVAGLSGVPQTLLIPLSARAYGPQVIPGTPEDPASRALAERLGYDPAVYLADRRRVRVFLERTAVLTGLTRDFLRRHPDGVGVNLGAGLATYFEQLDDGKLEWVDLDLPEVTALRQQVLPSTTPRHRVVTASLTDGSWLAHVDAKRPTVFLCEGVLNYLSPEEVRAVLRGFAAHAHPDSEFLCHVICWKVIGSERSVPMVKGTGAEFRWGPRRFADLASAHEKLEVLGVHSVTTRQSLLLRAGFDVFRLLAGVPFVAVYRLGLR